MHNVAATVCAIFNILIANYRIKIITAVLMYTQINQICAHWHNPSHFTQKLKTSLSNQNIHGDEQ